MKKLLCIISVIMVIGGLSSSTVSCYSSPASNNDNPPVPTPDVPTIDEKILFQNAVEVLNTNLVETSKQVSYYWLTNIKPDNKDYIFDLKSNWNKFGQFLQIYQQIRRTMGMSDGDNSFIENVNFGNLDDNISKIESPTNKFQYTLTLNCEIQQDSKNNLGKVGSANNFVLKLYQSQKNGDKFYWSSEAIETFQFEESLSLSYVKPEYSKVLIKHYFYNYLYYLSIEHYGSDVVIPETKDISELLFDAGFVPRFDKDSQISNLDDLYSYIFSIMNIGNINISKNDFLLTDHESVFATLTTQEDSSYFNNATTYDIFYKAI